MHPHSHSLLACAITLEEILGISCENPFVTMPSTWGSAAAAAVRVNVSSGQSASPLGRPLAPARPVLSRPVRTCPVLSRGSFASSASCTASSELNWTELHWCSCSAVALSQWHFISVGLCGKESVVLIIFQVPNFRISVLVRPLKAYIKASLSMATPTPWNLWPLMLDAMAVWIVLDCRNLRIQESYNPRIGLRCQYASSCPPPGRLTGFWVPLEELH